MKTCKICGRFLDHPEDPGSLDCGGDCQTCVLECELELWEHRVLVCGGVTFDDRDYLFRTMDAIDAREEFGLLINGNARGGDKLSSLWAQERGYGSRILTYNAKWNVHKRSAGPIRNRQMLEQGQPTRVVAFRGNRGTKNMLDQSSTWRRKVNPGLVITDLRNGDILL